MARADEGLKSELLKSALDEALAGKPARLEDLLERFGGMPSPKPNLKLAQAFGAELANLPGEVTRLLARLAREDCAPDRARIFLPIAAAHGYAARARAGREVAAAWSALLELAGDERGPVRVGTLDALLITGAKEGGADELVRRGAAWLDETDDREVRFGANALVLELLSEGRVMATLRDEEALFAFVTRSIDEVADAPRSAERSEGRRRVLVSLPRALAAIVVHLARAEAGIGYFRSEALRAEHPDVRAALSDAIQRLRGQGQGQRAAMIDELRKTLEDSAKPERYAALVRPGVGRGKKSRKTR
jgi:hypothetical protein